MTVECVKELSVQGAVVIVSFLMYTFFKHRIHKAERRVLNLAERGIPKRVLKNENLFDKMFVVAFAIRNYPLGFMSTERKETTFMDGSFRPPESLAAVRDVRAQGFMQMLFITSSEMKYIGWDALNHALFVGVVATAMKVLRQQDAGNEFLLMVASVSDFVSDFKYLPTFLIAFMVNSEAHRWQASFQLALAVQGRCHDLCLFISGAFDNLGPETRATHFKFYRYINAAHYMLYFRHDTRIASDPARVCEDLVVAGLVTSKEAVILRAAHPKMRDAIIGWIGNLFHREVREGRIPSGLSTKFLDECGRLRAFCTALSDTYDTYPTNTHFAMLGVTIRILIAALMLKYAGQVHDDNVCVHSSAIVMSFFIICCYLGMLRLMTILAKSPFDQKSKEPVNIDALLCETELINYTYFQAVYGIADLEELSDSDLKTMAKLSAAATVQPLPSVQV